MTVDELLSAIVRQYPGATPEAISSYKPVFLARLRPHEGHALHSAASEVFATFKATARQPFPIPVDFEQHLPKGVDLRGVGKALDVRGHEDHRKLLMATWDRRQYPRIAQARGKLIAGRCRMLAKDMAQQRAWGSNPEAIVLTVEQIQLCEDRMVSSERNVAYGHWAIRADDGGERWQRETEHCRAELRAGRTATEKPAKAAA